MSTIKDCIRIRVQNCVKNAKRNTSARHGDIFVLEFEKDIIKYYGIVFEMCEEIIKNSEYVYKLCEQYLIVLEKVHDTVTNENRKNVRSVNTNRARFRANKLLVRQIIDVKTGKMIDSFTNMVWNSHNHYGSYWSVTYTVNECVESSNGFDPVLENVCAPGIHYFKNIISALAYKIPDSDYAGRWIYWGSNGQKKIVGMYTHGTLLTQ